MNTQGATNYSITVTPDELILAQGRSSGWLTCILALLVSGGMGFIYYKFSVLELFQQSSSTLYWPIVIVYAIGILLVGLVIAGVVWGARVGLHPAVFRFDKKSGLLLRNGQQLTSLSSIRSVTTKIWMLWPPSDSPSQLFSYRVILECANGQTIGIDRTLDDKEEVQALAEIIKQFLNV
jgi:hypothetical protein